MSENFFNKFTEDTNVKLELYEDYLTEWLPVFISSPNPFKKTVNIMDLFSGPGKDEEGTYGSPLIALKVLDKYRGYVFNTPVEINLYFNDRNPKYIEELKANIEKSGLLNKKIKIHYSCKDFEIFYSEISAITKNSANLLFLDQFGIKYVNQEKFKNLVQLPVTDVIFFISSSTFKRFHNDNNVNKIIGLESIAIQKMDFYKIHRLVHQAYSDFIPENHSYGLAPFSIKKGTNVYGLIFGSGHPLGLEKFLDICWIKDETTGEANFDIQGDIELKTTPTLFMEEDGLKSKIKSFQDELELSILNGKLTSDLKIYLFAINKGFTNKHIKPVISKLKSEKKILFKHPSFKCSTVWNRKRQPKNIVILN